MEESFDDFPVKFTCGECSREFAQTVRDLKAKGKVICPGCGHRSDLDEANRQFLAAGEEEIARFIRSFK